MAVKSFSRSRSTRNKAISGIDLPEVAPEQGIEVRHIERASHIAPEARHYASGLEAVPVAENKEALASLERIDTSSTRGFLPSDSKPKNVEKLPFWRRNKRARWWIIGAAFLSLLILVVIITVAVTLSLSRRHATPAPSSPVLETVTASTSPSSAAPLATPTKGCPSYNGPPLSSLPSSIPRPGGPAPVPASSSKIATIHFSKDYSYDLANKDTQLTSDAFNSVALGLASALGSPNTNFVLNAFTPIDATPAKCYLQTVAKVAIPPDLQAPLQAQVKDRNSALYSNPNGNINNIMTKIDSIDF